MPPFSTKGGSAACGAVSWLILLSHSKVFKWLFYTSFGSTAYVIKCSRSQKCLELSDVGRVGIGTEQPHTVYLVVSIQAQCWGDEAGKRKRQSGTLGPYLVWVYAHPNPFNKFTRQPPSFACTYYAHVYMHIQEQCSQKPQPLGAHTSTRLHHSHMGTIR